MSLDLYRKKRDFSKTPEPSGRVGSRAVKARSFVIQKHAASHLHYDFRLELDGVLLSWAVPKGPSLDPRDKRLAMQTEDHPLEYGGFEGIIPEKQYGGGTVIVWDRGQWLPKDDPREGYRQGKLKFVLQGEKLRGGWTLVRSHGGKYGGRDGKQAWLLIKERDDEAREGADVVGERPESVLTKRTLEQVAQQKNRVWHSTKSVGANVDPGAVAPLKRVASRRTAPVPSAGDRVASKRTAKRALPSGARRAAMPAEMSAQLATLVAEAPTGGGWLHEIKYDGYRMLCRIERGRCRIWSRNGKEWTDAFPGIAAAAAKLPVKSAWIDGEIVMQAGDGTTSFQALQNALSEQAEAALVYFAFDLLYVDGYDLRDAALVERKRVLEPLLAGGTRIRYSEHFDTDGAAMLAQSCKLGLEGIISKRADARYQATRGTSWLKIKCGKRQELVVGGFTQGQGSRSGFGALLLGVYDKGKLRYAGKVGTGFDDAALKRIRGMLDKLRADKPPFVDPPTGAEGRRATWVQPTLVAEIAFTEWTRDGTLRHPSFQGLRLDKPAKDVVREQEAHIATAPASTSRSSAKGVTIAGVPISNPDKVLFADAGITKRELCEYYEAVAALMLPHVTDRPLTLVRCPDGAQGKCFYQKHAKDTVPAWVDRIEVQDSDGPAQYMMANNVKSLVTLAQLGSIEMHPWGSRKGKLEHPDRLILDLDPDDALPWSVLKDAALLVRGLLEDLGLRSFLKTTGGKGLHVVVPIAATMNWETAKTFVHDTANVLVRTFPDRFTATLSKRARPGKIFIDYLRNAHGATAIAPYSVRARAGAPVAAPVEWSALDADIRFDRFNLRSVATLLERNDPWKDLAKVRQTVTAAMRKRVAA